MTAWTQRQEQGRSVECKWIECRRQTWRDDAFCCDDHAVLYRARCAASEQAREGGRVFPRPAPDISPAGGESCRRLQPPAGDLRTEVC